MDTYHYTLLGTLAALAVFIWAMIGVGRARAKTGIKAPATSGHPDFERAFRAHQNSMEQLVIFLPLVWIVAVLFGDMWGGIYAAIWVVGRVLYVAAYTAAADKRSTGFMIGGLATLAALVASIAGVVMRLVG
jgi:glutathione S-transferase